MCLGIRILSKFHIAVLMIPIWNQKYPKLQKQQKMRKCTIFDWLDETSSKFWFQNTCEKVNSEKRIGKLFFPIGRCQKERRMILSQMAIVGKTSIFSATAVAQLLTMAVCEAKYKHSEYWKSHLNIPNIYIFLKRSAIFIAFLHWYAVCHALIFCKSLNMS